MERYLLLLDLTGASKEDDLFSTVKQFNSNDAGT